MRDLLEEGAEGGDRVGPAAGLGEPVRPRSHKRCHWRGGLWWWMGCGFVRSGRWVGGLSRGQNRRVGAAAGRRRRRGCRRHRRRRRGAQSASLPPRTSSHTPRGSGSTESRSRGASLPTPCTVSMSEGTCHTLAVRRRSAGVSRGPSYLVARGKKMSAPITTQWAAWTLRAPNPL